MLNEQPLCLCQLHLWQRTSWSVTIAKQVLQQPLHTGNLGCQHISFWVGNPRWHLRRPNPLATREPADLGPPWS